MLVKKVALTLLSYHELTPVRLSFDESLWRSHDFVDVGEDVLLIDALAAKEEMKAFYEIAPSIQKMVHFLCFFPLM